MKSSTKYDIIIIGASIAGLSHAYQAALLGLKVLVIDKSNQLNISSIATQGIIRSFGENLGYDYFLALRSREIWIDLFEKIKVPYHANGSYIIAQSKEEFNLIEELHEKIKKTNYKASLQLPYQIVEKNNIISKKGLWGGLYSPTEINFDINELYVKWLSYLQDTLLVNFLWETEVISVKKEKVYTLTSEYKANLIFVCCHLETSKLFPEIATQSFKTNKTALTILQPTSSKWKLGPQISGVQILMQDNIAQGLNSIEEYNKSLVEREDQFPNNTYFIISQLPNGQLQIGTYISNSNEQNQDIEKTYLHIYKNITSLLNIPRNTIIQKNIITLTNECLAKEPLSNPAAGLYIIKTVGKESFNLSMGYAFDNMNRILV